ncbi:MAG TPA: molybdopterin cofactor-binding domain-containing protein [Rhizomicrobium sp.]|nr:molybdopterin cofactor-binding domain-containing protein [Rhizomicrobium sp.]
MTTRRMVILGGLGAASALVVGYALWPSTRIARADAMAARAGERFVSNWIKIGRDDTVTVVIPHCDMGTGIFTSLSQMAAEELDADWNKVRAETAPADSLFANGPLGEGFILGEKDIYPNNIPAFLRGTVANSFRTIAGFMDLQVTGGSSAIRATGVFGIRIAAAAAREMLVAAAAARWNVAPETCSTRVSRVLHEASGRSFGFGELAADAARHDPSSHPRLKPKDQYTIVGKSVLRFDIPRKVDGTTAYGIDVREPGMLFAAIRISPVFGGNLRSVDAAPISGRRGIHKVIKLDDAVVVVADRFWRARDAAALLNPIFDDGVLGGVTSTTIAARRKAALDDALKSDLTVGSGADALKSQKVIEATYQVPYLAHATMEPMNATAIYRNGSLEVWSGTQDGLGSRAACAKSAGLPIEKVTFHLLPMGGGFGRRLPGFFNFLDYAVKTAMAVPGTPVKLVFTREQDMQHDFYRPNVMSRFRAALGAGGMPAVWVNDYTTDDDPNPEAHILYAIPNQAISAALVRTHVPTGPWRSVEASWHGFFIESFIDELAHRAKADPVAYRLKLLADKPRHAATLELAARKAGWGAPLAHGRGRGVAIVESFKSIVCHVADVTVAANGSVKIDRVVSAVDCGMAVNPDGMRAQIEGGILFGLGAAQYGEITIDKGAVAQANFPDYPVARLADCPDIEIHFHDSDAPLGGGGEPGVPPTAPAITNAIFAATGVRIRDLPIIKHASLIAHGATASL